MPPLDTSSLEGGLRAALHGRAATLTPSPDPLAGVERRARGLRRRRVGASVAGTALAVLAVAGAVPLLAPDRTAAPDPSRVASAPPSPAPARSTYAFDPEQPWEYRGDPAVLRDGNLETWQREWAAREPGARLVPLYGRVDEPSGRPEVVFASVSTTRDELLYGVATTSESGARFLVAGDTPRRTTTSFAVVLEGDEGALRLLVVADPDVRRLQYAADGTSPVELGALAPGVGTTPVAPVEAASDAYVVTGADGEEVERAGVPDQPARADDEEPGGAAPANVQEWDPRGTVDGSVVLDARDAYARQRRADVGRVQEKVLFAGSDDDGRAYLVGQFWLAGDATADTFGVVVRGDEDVEPQLHRPLPEQADVVALHLAPADEGSRSALVVVPRPGTGQVQHAPQEGAAWQAVDTPGLDGVVLLERSAQAERGEARDRLRLLDGDGAVITTVAVADLLCGATSCG